MIISVHIPKNAGTSFKRTLKAAFGDRAIFEPGSNADLLGPEAHAREQQRQTQAREMSKVLATKAQVIHGHFPVSRYIGLYDNERYAVFLRDPVVRLVSHYLFACSRKNPKHPMWCEVQEQRLSLVAFTRRADTQNLQSRFCEGLTLEQFDFVGITQEFGRSLRLFGHVFGVDVAEEEKANINSLYRDRGMTSDENRYKLDPGVEEEIRALNARDIDLYERGLALFSRRCEEAGIP